MLPKPPTFVEENMFCRIAAASLRAGEGSTNDEPRGLWLKATLTGVSEVEVFFVEDAESTKGPRKALLVKLIFDFLDGGGDINLAAFWSNVMSLSTVTSSGELLISTTTREIRREGYPSTICEHSTNCGEAERRKEGEGCKVRREDTFELNNDVGWCNSAVASIIFNK